MSALLEESRPKATPAREDGEFIDFGWRPIFKEHVRDGKVFDAQAMRDIAAECNKRVELTGDYCPIVITHTNDKAPNSSEVVGFFGPYKAARYGKTGEVHILAKERWYAEDAPKRKKFPRLSVEYWANKSSPTKGYIDPASALGSETPELDLGVHYGKSAGDDWFVTKYEAAAPGGSNTFVPGGSEKPKPTQYQSGGQLSQADIIQIIEALKPTIEQAVSAQVAAMSPAGADPDNLLTDEPADEAAGGPDDDTDLEESEGPDDFTGDDADFDTDDESEAGEVPDEQADLPDDEPESAPKPKKKDLYMADNAEVARYQKEAHDYRKRNEELTSELGELRTKYQKAIDGQRAAEEQHTQLAERVAGMEARERKAVRYQKLGEIQAKGFTFDVEEEFKDTAELSDVQFDRHCDRIQARYQRVPQSLGSKGIQVAESAKAGADVARDKAKRDRYAKLAMDNVARGRKENKAVTFKGEFDRLMIEDPEKIGTSAV